VVVDRGGSTDSNICALSVCAKRLIGNADVNGGQTFELIDVLRNTLSLRRVVHDNTNVSAELSLRSASSHATSRRRTFIG
jgi:hypothetical protein